MPRKCSVCAHPSKAEIDKRIVAGGESALTIARLFDLSMTLCGIRATCKPRYGTGKLLRLRGFRNSPRGSSV